MADSRINVTIKAEYTPSRFDLREAWIAWSRINSLVDRATAEAEFDRAWDVR